MSKFITINYKPGNHPLPMIMIFNKANLDVFNESYKKSFGTWDSLANSLWTINAYLLEKNNEIISYKYNDFANLIWLLRYLNKEVKINVSNEELELIKNNYRDEFQYKI